MGEKKYNAFISYRRTARDTAVAREIQQSLEHFRIPRGIRTLSGKARIDRIFRDQEELEITSDLSARIEAALRDSEYLIVICSHGYKESSWCLHELETFIGLRGKDHVLCVLSEGEPPAVFPEMLLHSSEEATTEDGISITVDVPVEPLACDYRGSFKAARRTELPRLAAVMLGCSYDELVLRRERYRRRRLATLFSGISVLAAAAITWLLWSNAQISRSYRQSQISESKLLAMRSLDAFGTQDRLQALNTALEALTSEQGDRPITDEAQYAVAQASYAYATPYHWLETWRIDEVNDITDFFISKDRNFLVCMDRTGQFQSFDLETRRKLCSFRVRENTIPTTPVEGKDGELLCYDTGEVFSVDYRSGEVNWSMPLQYQTIGSVYRSSNGSYIAAADSFAVQILTESGEPHLSLPLPDSTGGYITGLCWSPDDSRIAVKLKISGAQQERAGIFNMETSAFTLLDPEYQHIIQFCFDKEGTFYLLGTVQEGEHSKEGITTILVPNRYELSAFCGETLQWSTQIEEKNLTDSVSLTTTAKKEWKIILTAGTVLRAFGQEGTETLRQDTKREILGLDTNEEGAPIINFVAVSGEYGTLDPETGSVFMQKIFPDELDKFTGVADSYGVVSRYVVFHQGNLSMFDSVSDDNIRLFDGEGIPFLPDGYLQNGECLVTMTDRILRFYDLNAKIQIATTELDRNAAWHLLAEQNQVAYLLRIDGKEGKLAILAVNMRSGEILREDPLPLHDFYVQNSLLQGPFSIEEEIYLDRSYTAPGPAAVQGECVFIHDQENCNRILIYSLADGSTEQLDLNDVLGEERRLLYEETSFLLPSPLVISPDGATLFTAFTDRRDGSRGVILVRIEDGSVTLLPGIPDDLSSVAFADDGVVYAGTDGLYLCAQDGELQNTITFTGDNAVSFAWNCGRLYCVFPDGGLEIYENGELIRRVPLSFDLSMQIIDGRDFRYEFLDNRLYLYCGNVMNVVMLDSDGETAVYYADSVLTHLADREELLVYSNDRERARQEGDLRLYLGSFREYSVAELIKRAREQVADFYVR